MTASARGTEGLVASEPSSYLPCFGWTTGEVASALASVRIQSGRLAVTQASVRKKACCLLLLKVPQA